MAKANDAKDAAAITAAMARETQRRRERRQAQWDQHNAEFHGGAECDGSCED